MGELVQGDGIFQVRIILQDEHDVFRKREDFSLLRHLKLAPPGFQFGCLGGLCPRIGRSGGRLINQGIIEIRLLHRIRAPLHFQLDLLIVHADVLHHGRIGWKPPALGRRLGSEVKFSEKCLTAEVESIYALLADGVRRMEGVHQVIIQTVDAARTGPSQICIPVSPVLKLAVNTGKEFFHHFRYGIRPVEGAHPSRTGERVCLLPCLVSCRDLHLTFPHGPCG